MMIARTQPRPERASTAISDGVGKPRHASISRTPPIQSRFWFKAILIGILFGITSSYVYWRETSFSPKSPAYNNFHDAYEQQKYTEAIKIVRRHADRGNAEAQYALAVMNDRGQGTAIDHKTAYKLYRQAAAQGHLEATVLVKKIDAYEKALSKPK
jgi:TPR repeat protein